MCAACTKHFVGSQLTSKTYPMTCSICKVEVPACDIHRLLNNNELESYTNLAISRNLIGNEVLFTCQNVKCEAACILEMGPCNGHSPDYTSTWVRCFDCRVLTCAICLQTSTRVIKKHSAECAELCEIKRAFETAVAEGAAFRCPKCKLAGRKDTGCNSIYCLQCHTNWCYVCGKAQDKSHGCAAHGYGAVTANKLDDLHRERTLQLLRQVYTGCNSQLFRKVWDRFPSIPAHGFSWVEITGSPYK